MSLYNCVCQGRVSGLQLSQEGFPWSGPQDLHETASVYFRHARLLWTRASTAAFDEVSSKRGLNTIVSILIERNNFVQKCLSALLWLYDTTSKFFKGIQDFERYGRALVLLLLYRVG